MSQIDFITAAKREIRLLESAVNLMEAPEASKSHDWLVVLAYRTPQTLLSINCELARGYGVDVTFASVDPDPTSHDTNSFHTFLRMYDLPAALELGTCLPSDQRDMDDLLRFYVAALLKHRAAVFDHPQQTLTCMDRIFQTADFVNQPFSPSGRFCGSTNT